MVLKSFLVPPSSPPQRIRLTWMEIAAIVGLSLSIMVAGWLALAEWQGPELCRQLLR